MDSGAALKNFFTPTLLVVTFIFVVLLIAFGVAVWQLARKKKDATDEVVKSKLSQTQIIVYAGFAIIFLFFLSGVIVHAINGEDNFLMNLSVTIIVSWIVLLICYYAWALYFYNINLGWSDDKWNRFRGQQEDPTAGGKAPNTNPHDEQTLGLPPGTVRGTIALTLLVGGLALTIASFSMDSSVKSSVILIDNFDFYKTAFLMMIAFYFGTRSLEILQKKTPSTQRDDSPQPQQPVQVQPPPALPSPPVNITNGQVRQEDLQKDFHHAEAKG